MKRTKKLNSELLEAIKFVSLAQSKTGKEMSTNCRFSNNQIVAFNGVIAAGIKTELELNCCPQTDMLRLALERCGEKVALTILDNALGVRSGDFQAFVPCCEPSRLPAAAPDAPAMAINDQLTDAFRFLLPVVSDKAEYLLHGSIQVRSGYALATDNTVLIEAWHSFDLPPMTLPRAAAYAIVKCGKSLTAFGYSGDSATFWFEDAWIKSTLFRQELPDLYPTINKPVDLRAIPNGYFEAVKQVSPFSNNGKILIDGSIVSSSIDRNTGGKIERLEASLEPRIYSFKSLKFMSFADTMDERTHQRQTYFYGKNIRGCIAHTIPAKPCETPGCTGGCDKCIPF